LTVYFLFTQLKIQPKDMQIVIIGWHNVSVKLQLSNNRIQLQYNDDIININYVKKNVEYILYIRIKIILNRTSKNILPTFSTQFRLKFIYSEAINIPDIKSEFLYSNFRGSFIHSFIFQLFIYRYKLRMWK